MTAFKAVVDEMIYRKCPRTTSEGDDANEFMVIVGLGTKHGKASWERSVAHSKEVFDRAVISSDGHAACTVTAIKLAICQF